ncbi:MAG: hypothetical protein INH34_10335 [Phycisphaerales bacterium]|nr:hypothetical protein [Phycisphaerales bacterium]
MTTHRPCRTAAPTRPARRTAIAGALLAAAACAGPAPDPTRNRAGLDRTPGAEFVSARVHHGVPILQKSFFWDGNGEVDNTGVGFHWGRFVDERLALGVGSNVANWWTGGRDVHSVELEGLIRVYPEPDWPLFVSGTGGYQLANDQIPPGGTVWNFSFSFGAGVDIPVAAGTSALIALDYHHISNALGRESQRNPSQNEARFWIGIGWSF